MTDTAPGSGISGPGGALSSLDELDAAYLRHQDGVAAALAEGDAAGATGAASAGAELRAIDADGRIWRILGPLATADPVPHYRYRYRHQRSTDGERFWTADGFRFTKHPSLAAAAADRVPDGWLRTAIRFVEPAGYAATAMVGLGLWLLLGDLIGSLPGIAVLVAMVVAAAGLWWASISVDDLQYREAGRLSELTLLAAIGVTGAVAWVATIEADSVTTATRVLLCAVTVLAVATASFLIRDGVGPWTIALGAWPVAAMAAAIVIAEVAYEDPDMLASAQLGALAATAVGVPLATRTARLRWIPIGVPFLALAAGWALLGTIADSPRALHTVLVIVGGVVASVAVWASRTMMHPRLRSVHRFTVSVLASLTAIVAVAQGPWEDLFDWLADVPLPVLLVVVGSAVLIGVGSVIRLAVRRLAD